MPIKTIKDLSDIFHKEMEDNKKEIQLNKEIIATNEEIIKEKSSIKGCLLTEYNKRTIDAEEKYRKLREKNGILLAEFVKENRDMLTALQEQRDSIQELHQELSRKHEDNKELQRTVDTQLEKREELIKKCQELEVETQRLRKYANTMEIDIKSNKKYIKKLEEQKNLQEFFLDNKEVKDKCLEEITVQEGTITIERGD